MDPEYIRFVVKKAFKNFPNIHGTILVAQSDQILYHQSFSYFNFPFSKDKYAQYLIASITKQLTAAALLKSLYDKHSKQGVPEDDIESLNMLIMNDLHIPLSTFLVPEHPIWERVTPAWAHQVTLHHLLTHTSGIRSYEEPLVFRPSEKYLYSNLGYIMLGWVIEEVTQEPLALYFKRVLFDPAQMRNTNFPSSGTPKDISLDPEFQKLALGFVYKKVNKQKVFIPASENAYFNKLSTAGGIISTAYDLAKWNSALYHNKIIPEFLVDKMITKYVSKEVYPFYDGFNNLWSGYL